MKIFARAALAAFLLFYCAESFAHPIAARHTHTESAHGGVTIHNRAPQGHMHTTSAHR